MEIIGNHNEVALCELSDAYGLNLSTEVSSRDNGFYNCMGFAIGTYEWDELGNFECSYEYDYDGNTVPDYMELRDAVCWDCADELENLHYSNPFFPKMRIVKSERDLLDNEYLIAMRVAEEDFHFMRRMSDGRWFEKCGPNILRECTDEVFDDEWISIFGLNVYNSVTVFLAVEEQEAT